MQRLHAEMDAILTDNRQAPPSASSMDAPRRAPSGISSIDAQMDALLAESSASKLTAQQQMMLRQGTAAQQLTTINRDEPGFRRPPGFSPQAGGPPRPQDEPPGGFRRPPINTQTPGSGGYGSQDPNG